MNYNREEIRTIIADYAAITAGTLLIAAAVVYYLVPLNLVTGSVSGLALVLSQVLPLNQESLVLILNLLCFLAGVKAFGKRFGIRSLYVSVMLPVLMKLLPLILNPSHVQCGLLPGIAIFLILLSSGQMILFASDTASGGIDTAAEIIARRCNIRTGTAISAAGILTCFSGLLAYDLKVVLIGIAVTGLNGIILNLLQNGIEMLARTLQERRNPVSAKQ